MGGVDRDIDRCDPGTSLTRAKKYAEFARQCIETAWEGQRNFDDRYAWVAPGGELPPFLVERIKIASDEELEQIRTRMRERGWQDSQIEAAIAKARGEAP